MSNPRPEEIINRLAPKHNLTIGTAESCTGGLVAHRLTTVSGSSTYFMGGIVSYSNEVKERLLGVPRRILEEEGAVSEACALAMARGVLQAVGVQVGVSTTGVAGPTGATATKPVGLIYLALVAPGYERCERYIHSDDRSENINFGAETALRMLVEYLEGLEPKTHSK
jgi:PncC family amidohydrolase